jgi:hypothetical protein
MTAKVTLSFSDDTIVDARAFAQRDGVSLSAWVDQATRERALRELFGAHADAIRRAGFDLEAAALADEREIEMVDAAMFHGSGFHRSGLAGLGFDDRAAGGPGAAGDQGRPGAAQG